jgi:site-specific DNA-methyltransferase (adenine-specific)
VYALSITKLRDKLVLGNCLDILKKLPDESIDAIVTDPPYGIKFLGSDWDRAIPPIEVWIESLRVLKHGAFAFIMSSPRQDVQYRMIQNLESAGFEIGFTPIYWTYATGFPKALSISKAIDKKKGVERKKIYRSPNFRPDSMGIERNQGKSFVVDLETSYWITEPATSEAKRLDGSFAGFQPKPAVEVILVAMKPLSEKTFMEQVLANRKGITWLDDCRIPVSKEDLDTYHYNFMGRTRLKGELKPMFSGGYGDIRDEPVELSNTRFPANLLVSDDILNNGKKHQPSLRPLTSNRDSRKGLFDMGKKKRLGGGFPDSGSFSRYFSLDLWWSENFKELPLEVQKTFPFFVVSKASKSEKDKGCEIFQKSRKLLKPNYRCKKCGHRSFSGSPCTCIDPEWEIVQTHKKGGNIHPTVKPIKLMSYLVILSSRKGDLVLDPYIGSGTTAIACRLHRRNYLGCDINKEWLTIALARLKAVKRSFDLSKLMKKKECDN